MRDYKFISWNINGIRAALKKGFLEFFLEKKPDFLCLQETKAHEEQLGFELLAIPDYTSYFVSGERKGYSGVAVYANEPALKHSKELDGEHFNNEGRQVILEYPEFFLVNTYIPNGQRSLERLEYKMAYHEALLAKLVELKATGKAVIVCGDFNVAHKEIDLFHPKENAKRSGFLPEERAWVDKLIKAGFVDTFRLFNQEPGNYTWWDQLSKARERNDGWRIDYFFIDAAHSKNVNSATILPEVYGSDHCPITLTISI